MSTPSATDLLACAIEAAKAAGNHAIREASRRSEILSLAAHDVKLQLDKECQQRAEEVVRSAYPDHAILGEEGSSDGAEGAPRWVIDPIDGTVNFFHGLTYWCSSVAVQVGDQTLAGVVYAPVSGEVFAAQVGKPALRNGEPIQVSRTPSLESTLALTGLEKSVNQESRALEVLRTVSLRIQKVRLLGAAALDVCQVASGRADAFFEQGINLWDIAAGDLIVQQAGGRTEVLQPRPNNRMRYLCSNGLVHDALKELLQPFAVQG